MVLDANVVYSMPLLDTAIRVAQMEICAVRWSSAILDEAKRNLMAVRPDPARIAARFAAMRAAFPDWEVCGYEALVPTMTCDPKDRHVLAAAIVRGASQIVTADARGFPPTSLAPYGIEAVSPDDFLLNVLDLDRRRTVEAIRSQAAALKRPSATIADVLKTLADRGAPGFAREVERICDDVASRGEQTLDVFEG